MELEELKQTEWYKERPQIIKDAIEIRPPIHLYKLTASDKQCWIVAYTEPDNGKVEDVTLTVQKIGKGGVMADAGLGMLDTNQVFGLGLNDIVKLEE